MCRAIRAHPRSRGEHASIKILRATMGGSSPLARGTLLVFCVNHHRAGLIPARAGNTLAWIPATIMSRAHPRSRGEHEGYCEVGQ